MLYQQWLKVVGERPAAVALWDYPAGRRWSFAELAEAVEAAPGRDRPSTLLGGPAVACPQGNTAGFVLSVLEAWRSGTVVAPLEAGQPRPELPELPSGWAHLKSTSATTGVARWVGFRAEQLMADARNIVETMGLRPDWPNIGAISLAHSYGFSNLVLPLVLHGIPLVLTGTALPEAVRQVLREVGPATLAGVPALWRAWQEAGAICPSVKLAISAGAPLPLALERGVFEQLGVKIHNFYGATECGGIAYDGSAEPRTEAGLAGSAMRHVDLSVGAQGALEVRSGAVGESYWPESSSALGGGRFRTCDLAEMVDGMVWLRGRMGDEINVAGRKVAPELVEEALRTHPVVAECLVFGVPATEGVRAETMVACVRSSAEVSAAVLRRFLLERLPAWQVPREWWFPPELAVNHRGKLSRAEWRRRYLEGAERSAGLAC